MIINVTDKEKLIIEAHGYMVVQYKKFCTDVEPILNHFVNHVVDENERLILFFQHTLFKIMESMQPVFGLLLESCKELQRTTEAYRQEYSCRKTIPYCKDICKKHNQNFRHKVIYHRCRDRC